MSPRSIATAAVAAVATTATAGALALPSQGATTVRVKDDFFSPKTVTVTRGATVKFVWAGKRPHDLRISGPKRGGVSSARTKGTYSFKTGKKGTYRFICTIHAGMAGKIVAK